jgi:hypothetical protein
MNKTVMMKDVLREILDKGEVLREFPAEPILILAAPWPGNRLIGNKQVRCAECNSLCVLSKEAQAMMEGRNNIDSITCPPCAKKHYDAMKGQKQ